MRAPLATCRDVRYYVPVYNDCHNYIYESWSFPTFDATTDCYAITLEHLRQSGSSSSRANVQQRGHLLNAALLITIWMTSGPEQYRLRFIHARRSDSPTFQWSFPCIGPSGRAISARRRIIGDSDIRNNKDCLEEVCWSDFSMWSSSRYHVKTIPSRFKSFATV